MKTVQKQFLDKKRPKGKQDVHLKDYELVITYYRQVI